MTEVKILSHMNKDHALSIEDYLVVYGKVYLGHKISNIKMSEINTNQMTITFKHEDIEFDITKVIPFEPPLKDLSEARVRLVEMAKFAANERELAHFQIKDYKYPSFLNWVLISVIYLPAVAFFFPDALKTPIVSQFISPSFVDFLHIYGIHIVFLTVLIHALEAYFILEPKLEKYRVPTEFKIEWYISVLVEGYPAIKRLNQLVSEHDH